jgi:hypothetical protein
MSNEKRVAKVGNSNAVQLHNSGLRAGSLLDQSFSNLSSEQAQNLLSNAAQEVLRLEVKNREQNMAYHIGRKAVEDHIETFNMLERKGATTRQTVKSEISTGAGRVRIESKSGATCFVASVAYANPNHPDVMFLRYFRDNLLNKTKVGKNFIKWYWKWGPRLAIAVAHIPLGATLSRVFLRGIVISLNIFIHFPVTNYKADR